jgi:hypothetical protein
LYTNYVVTAGAVLYADCSVTAGANTRIKGFADACYKGEEGVAEGVVCCKNEKDKQGREKVIASLVKVKLRRS